MGHRSWPLTGKQAATAAMPKGLYIIYFPQSKVTRGRSGGGARISASGRLYAGGPPCLSVDFAEVGCFFRLLFLGIRLAVVGRVQVGFGVVVA